MSGSTGCPLSAVDVQGTAPASRIQATATEVSSDNSALMRNIRKNENALTGALGDVARALLSCARGMGVALPDEGDVDMLEAVRAYQRGGYAGPLCPDHVPVSELDEGRERFMAFALGYTRGLLQAAGVWQAPRHGH